MKQVTALKIVLGIALFGILFSGALSYQELFSHPSRSCGAIGATGTIFGYPACVYGFLLYCLIALIVAWSFRGSASRR